MKYVYHLFNSYISWPQHNVKANDWVRERRQGRGGGGGGERGGREREKEREGGREPHYMYTRTHWWKDWYFNQPLDVADLLCLQEILSQAKWKENSTQNLSKYAPNSADICCCKEAAPFLYKCESELENHILKLGKDLPYQGCNWRHSFVVWQGQWPRHTDEKNSWNLQIDNVLENGRTIYVYGQLLTHDTGGWIDPGDPVECRQEDLKKTDTQGDRDSEFDLTLACTKFVQISLSLLHVQFTEDMVSLFNGNQSSLPPFWGEWLMLM